MTAIKDWSRQKVVENYEPWQLNCVLSVELVLKAWLHTCAFLQRYFQFFGVFLKNLVLLSNFISIFGVFLKTLSLEAESPSSASPLRASPPPAAEHGPAFELLWSLSGKPLPPETGSGNRGNYDEIFTECASWQIINLMKPLPVCDQVLQLLLHPWKCFVHL